MEFNEYSFIATKNMTSIEFERLLKYVSDPYQCTLIELAIVKYKMTQPEVLDLLNRMCYNTTVKKLTIRSDQILLNEVSTIINLINTNTTLTYLELTDKKYTRWRADTDTFSEISYSEPVVSLLNDAIYNNPKIEFCWFNRFLPGVLSRFMTQHSKRNIHNLRLRETKLFTLLYQQLLI